MRLFAVLILAALAFSCSGPADKAESLCDRFFTPYPDVITQRERTPLNSAFMDAMEMYVNGNYAHAIPILEEVVHRNPRNNSARMYLVSALLAEKDPYRAEMHLDFLENYRDKSYRDQVEWYNALCWLCEGNLDKAAQQARYIAAKPHTYRHEAAQLAQALTDH